MLTETDLKIISLLRRNSRQSLALIARKVGVPSSTLFDKMGAYEKKFIYKHTTLLDFGKLGFSTKVQIALEVPLGKKEQVQEFLSKHKNINSLYKINHGFDFLMECIFKNQADAKNFIEQLQANFGIEHSYIFDVLEELKKEEFVPWQENFKS